MAKVMPIKAMLYRTILIVDLKFIFNFFVIPARKGQSLWSLRFKV